MITRRLVVAGLASALASPAVFAQARAAPRRIAFLFHASKQAADDTGRYRAFADGLRDAGLVEGPDLTENFHRAAWFVDRILKGARPGDLPFEHPSTYQLVVNVTTAKALGLTLPASLLARADRVIE